MISRGKLFISGGGGAQDSFLLDRAFVDALKNRKILYIPIGLKRDIVGYEECYDWIKNTLFTHTDKNLDIIMWIELKKKAEQDLKDFDAIYIGGAGSAYDLLRQMYKTGFTDLLLKFFKNGGILYGGSAGAVIMGKYIIPTGKDMGQKPRPGLRLIKSYSIYCHYNKDQDSIIKTFINNYKSPVIALPESSGLITEKNDAMVVGCSSIVIFSLNFEKIHIKPKKSFVL